MPDISYFYRVFCVDSTCNTDFYNIGRRLVTQGVLVCSDREKCKELLREEFGESLSFRKTKNLKDGDLYAVLLGECYNEEQYLTMQTFECSFCKAHTTALKRNVYHLNNEQIRYAFPGEPERKALCFCSAKCLENYIDQYGTDSGEWITPALFVRSDIIGYIYKITRKSTGDFYIGKTVNLPVFRWGQHLKTERFPVDSLEDLKFEVLEIVFSKDNVSLGDREVFYIRQGVQEDSEHCLNEVLYENYERKD